MVKLIHSDGGLCFELFLSYLAITCEGRNILLRLQHIVDTDTQLKSEKSHSFFHVPAKGKGRLWDALQFCTLQADRYFRSEEAATHKSNLLRGHCCIEWIIHHSGLLTVDLCAVASLRSSTQERQTERNTQIEKDERQRENKTRPLQTGSDFLCGINRQTYMVSL